MVVISNTWLIPKWYKKVYMIHALHTWLHPYAAYYKHNSRQRQRLCCFIFALAVPDISRWTLPIFFQQTGGVSITGEPSLFNLWESNMLVQHALPSPSPHPAPHQCLELQTFIYKLHQHTAALTFPFESFGWNFLCSLILSVTSAIREKRRLTRGRYDLLLTACASAREFCASWPRHHWNLHTHAHTQKDKWIKIDR